MQTATEYLEEGNKQYQQGSILAAIQHYKMASKLDPTMASLYHNLGLCYQILENYPEAISFFKKALEVRPNKASYYCCLGNCYFALDNNTEAIETFYKALEFDPLNAEIYERLGAVYYEIKDYTKAIDYYTKAVNYNPNSADSYSGLASSYCISGDYKNGIECHIEAINLAPDESKYFMNLATAYVFLNECQKAIAIYNMALKLDPQDETIYFYIGICYEKLGDVVNATSHFLKTVQLNPEHAEAYVKLGACFYSGNKPQIAIDYYLKAIKIDPNNTEAYNNISAIYIILNNQAKAVEYLSKSIELEPNNLRTLLYAGNMYFRAENYKKATECYLKVLKIEPTNIEASRKLLECYFELDEYTKAEEYLSKMLLDSPYDKDILFNLGICNFCLKNEPKAMASFLRAIEIDPKYANAYFGIGTLYKEYHNDYIKASEYYQCFFYANQDELGVDNINTLHVFYTKIIEAPMLIYRLKQLLPADINNYYKNTTKPVLQKVEAFLSFLETHKAEDTSKSLQIIKALVHYFLGDHGTAFNILKSLRFSVFENYYYAQVAKSIGKIYKIDPNDIYKYNVDSFQAHSERDKYYLGLSYRQLGEIATAKEIFKKISNYLPALYQLLAMNNDPIERQSLITQIKEIESNLPENERFSGSFSRKNDSNNFSVGNIKLNFLSKLGKKSDKSIDDYLNNFVDYAHYIEIQEALVFIDSTHKIKSLSEAILF